MTPLTQAPGWRNVPVPQLHPKYEPGISVAEAKEFLQYDPVTKAVSLANLALLARYSRLSFTEGTDRFYSVRKRFPPHRLVPGCEATVLGRPFELTLTSPVWPKHLQSPLTLVDAGQNRAQLVLKGPEEQSEIGEPGPFDPACPPMNQLAYQREDGSFTVNPLQRCATACTYCSRLFEELQHLNREPRQQVLSELVQLTPEQMAIHLVHKFPDTDWSATPQVAIVTGSFHSFEHLYNHTKAFANALTRATGGAFDPRAHQTQSLRVFTHLVNTPEQFRLMRECGAKSVVLTMEVFGDQVREATMPTRNGSANEKGSLRDTILKTSITAGLDELGQSDFAVACILGLDEYSPTEDGLGWLRDAGLKTLSALVFKPATHRTIAGFAVSLEELIRLRDLANTEFSPLAARPAVGDNRHVPSMLELV